MRRLVAFISASGLFTALLFLVPAPAPAVPVFANGQGVSCETCHTTFPAMTRYGMMVMMSNFQLLNRHLQDRALPVAVRLYITSHLGNQDQKAQTSVSDLSFLGGGFLGRNFTWYGEQHVIDSGVIGQTEQFWLSWNGLFGGTNSLQLGKFHTPFPFMPAHAWTIGSYLLATQTTGQNEFDPNDARWGAAFNGMSNEFMYNLSYLTGSGPTSDALDFNRSLNPRTLDLNVSYGGMEVPWSVGVVAMRGFAPLHDPANNRLLGDSDAFTREGLYYGYQTDKWHFQSMFYHGFDNHPDLGEFNVPLNGFMFEAVRDLGWHNHLLVRYDVASSDTLNRQYVLDYSHNIQPNLALIGELATGPGSKPQITLQLAFAGPYISGNRYLWKPPARVVVVPAAAGAVNTIAAESAASTSSAVTVASSGDSDAGAKLVGQNGCTGCHGANFQGGLGPKLMGIEHRLTPTQMTDFIKNPRAPMPNFGFTDAQIGDIVSYLSSLDGGVSGAQPTIALNPENPATQATITVRFPGTPPKVATASAIMQMGRSSHSDTVTLQPTADPHVWMAALHFSMGGPWTIEVRYDGNKLDKPIQVGAL